jgi:hypothetical protein
MRILLMLVFCASLLPAQEKSSLEVVSLGVLGFGTGFKYMDRTDYAGIFHAVEVGQLMLATNPKWKKAALTAFAATKLVELIAVLELNRRYHVGLVYRDGPGIQLKIGL